VRFIHEATYLEELTTLCSTMLWHADRFLSARREWLESEDIRLQGEMRVAMEGFLTAWARTSLLLFPATPERKRDAKESAEARGSTLRQILEVDGDHPLSDRGLRNAWMHYDERLDAALERHGRVT
jgi:hypothetical protein